VMGSFYLGAIPRDMVWYATSVTYETAIAT
jgi:hypothetical protein